MHDKPRLIVLNQYYWPGVEATAHLLSELAEALADDFEIAVVTGMVPGAEEAGATERNGVRIVRVRSTAFDRSRLALRATNYLTYLAQSLLQALRVERPDVVLCMTDPPVIADVALIVARRDELQVLAKVLEVGQLLFMGYQPRELLPLSLSAADVRVVGLASGLSGYVVPSRLYGSLAVGRPVIVAADRESETAKIVEE